MNVEKIICKNQVFAIIFYNRPITPGVHFFTDDESLLQVGKQRRRKGELIKPHKHMPVKVKRTETLQEVLYIEKGKVKITFYDDQNRSFENRVLGEKDMIPLIRGGHGFEFLDETEMVEIKQGPYDPKSTERLEVQE